MAASRRRPPGKGSGQQLPSAAWTQWYTEREGVKAFLYRLKHHPQKGVEAWEAGMKKHYKARLKMLNANEPPKYG